MDLEKEASQKPQSPPDSASHKRSGWLGVGFVLLLALAAFFAWRIDQFGRRIDQLSRQVKLSEESSAAALRRASQAQVNAQLAAQQRDQAEANAARSKKAALLAHQQAQAAQNQAAQAEQKAQQYRKEREAELTRLQQALGQIAETRRTAMGVIMTLDSNSIHFDFDKATLKPQYREVLSKIAGILMTLRGYRIFVYGYTDDIGTQAYNLKLSERRAETVRNYLVKAGLNPSIISTKGFGKSDPRVPGSSPQARAMNRRVEIGIVDYALQYPAPVSLQQ